MALPLSSPTWVCAWARCCPQGLQFLICKNPSSGTHQEEPALCYSHFSHVWMNLGRFSLWPMIHNFQTHWWFYSKQQEVQSGCLWGTSCHSEDTGLRWESWASWEVSLTWGEYFVSQETLGWVHSGPLWAASRGEEGTENNAPWCPPAPTRPPRTSILILYLMLVITYDFKERLLLL